MFKRIKIITSYSYEELEEKVNEFLSSPNVYLEEIHFEDLTDTLTSMILIVYTDVSEKEK